MGVLAPLYVAGLAALALPLLFHLVRRTPRGRQVFSSLMFLAPTPPRLTRRSRLDQVLLLVCRLGALALLAFAFARPFLRESALLALGDLPQRRVAILIDTSASMRRGTLWREAIQQAERELDDLAPHDEVALYTFSDRLEAVVRFQSDRGTSGGSSQDVIRQRLQTLEPTWAAGDLGAALTTLAAELDSAGQAPQTAAEAQITLISDLQSGSGVESLGASEWPQRVRLIARPVVPQGTTNAFPRLLVAEAGAPAGDLRVRVASAADSAGDQFFVRWAGESDPAGVEGEVAVYVPPGQSRVVRLPRPAGALLADRIVLRGDDHDFDNTCFVAPPRKQNVTVLYAGSEAADDPQGLLHYLRLAASGDPLREVTIQAWDGLPAALTSPAAPQLVVTARSLSAELQTPLKTYVEQGGTLVLVPSDGAAAAAIPACFEDVMLEEPPAGTSLEEPPAGRSLERPPAERSPEEFLLLGAIDFTHPLFTSFANPRYSDFTKIHFWNHRPVRLAADAKTQVVARFDNGDPWILERPAGKGRWLALTSGWRPDDSQLAVSSKFVPLIGGLLNQACGTTRPLAGGEVNRPVTLPEGRTVSLAVRMPDGRELQAAADASTFDRTALPGVYRLGAGPDESPFAVNLAASESNTVPLLLQRLQQLGVRVGEDLTRAEFANRIRQERDSELEGRQKVWRWLLVACLSLLIFETWWAGRAARSTHPSVEAAV